jgi:hypothetical protein
LFIIDVGVRKGNNKITELRTILQRESQKNSEQSYKGKVKRTPNNLTKGKSKELRAILQRESQNS